MARVISAVALTAAQATRLADALSHACTAGRSRFAPRSTRPSCGGLVVRVGDEVIDGSVAARLADVEGRTSQR